MITGAIFDLDGVILDSLEIWGTLGTRYLEKHNIKAPKNLGDILFPMTLDQSVFYLKTHFDLDFSLEEMNDELEGMIKDYYFYEVKTKDGAGDILQYYHNRRIPMMIATSSPKVHAIKALERLGILKYFVGVISTSEVENGKYSPEIYRKSADYMGSDIKSTYVFEDAAYALKTAHDDGFVTVGIFDKYGDHNQEEVQLYSDFYLESLDRYISIID